MAVGRSNIGRISRGTIEFSMSDLSDNNRIPLTMWFDKTIITGKDKVIEDNLPSMTRNEYEWTISAELNIARGAHSATGTSTNCMVQGGYDGSYKHLNTTESYNGSIWIANTTTLNTNRRDHSATGTSTNCMVQGGYVTTTESYNGSIWTTNSARLNANRHDHSATGTSTNCMLQGGNISNINNVITTLNTTESYNGSIWTTNTNTLNIGRFNHTATGTATNCMVQGGSSNDNKTTTESYNGSIWTTNTSTLSITRYNHSATGTSTNCMVQGGSSNNNVLNTTESYNGSIWTTNSTVLNIARGDHSATGTSTNCMIQGGSSNNNVLNTTESYKKTNSTEITDLELISYTPTEIIDNKGTYDIESKMMIISDPQANFPGGSDPSSLSINSATISHNIIKLCDLGIKVIYTASGGSPNSAIISGISADAYHVTQTYNGNTCKTVDSTGLDKINKIRGSGTYNALTAMGINTAYNYKNSIINFDGNTWSTSINFSYNTALEAKDSTGTLNGLSIVFDSKNIAYYNGESISRVSSQLSISPAHAKISGNINKLLISITNSNTYIANIYNGNSMKTTSSMPTLASIVGAMFEINGNFIAIANGIICEYDPRTDIWKTLTGTPNTNDQFSGASNGSDGFYDTMVGDASTSQYSTYLEGMVNPIDSIIDKHKNDINKLYFSKPIQNEWITNTIDLNKINGGVISLVDKNQADNDIFTNQVTDPINIKFPRTKVLKATVKYESEGIWEVGMKLPSERAYASGAGSSLNNQMFFGGYNGSYWVSTYICNGATWTTGTNLTGYMRDQASCGLYYSCIISGGYNGNYLNTTYRFNGSTTITTGATLPITLSRHSMVGVSNAAKTVMGYNGSNIKYSYLWNGSSWSTAVDYPEAGYYSAASGNTNSMLVTGIYNTSINKYVAYWNGSSWSTKPYLINSKIEHAQTGSGTFANIGGGSSIPVYSNTSYTFDGDKWRANQSLMNVTRRYRPVSNINGSANSMTAIGGYNGSYLSVTELFNKEYKDIPVKVKVNLPVSFKGFGDINLEINPYEDIGNGCWFISSADLMDYLSYGCLLGNITGNSNMQCNGINQYGTSVNSVYLFNGNVWSNTGITTNYSNRNNDGVGSVGNAMLAGGYSNGTYTLRYDGSSWSSSNNIPASVNSFRTEGRPLSALLVAGRNNSAVAVTTTYFYNDSAWSTSINCPVATSSYGSVGNASNFLMFGGYESNAGFYIYNGYTWYTCTNMNVQRPTCAANGTPNNAVLFGTNTNSITEKYNGYTFNTAGDINVKRSSCYNSANIAAGGSSNSAGDTKSTEIFSDSHKFDITADMIDYNGNDNILTFETDREIREFEEMIDYENGVWSIRVSIPSTRAFFPAMLGSVNNCILIGGSNDTDTTTVVWNGSTWSSGPNLGTGRKSILNQAVGLYNTGFLAGGQSDGTASISTEKFNGSTWSTSTSMPKSLYDFAMVGIQNAAKVIAGYSNAVSNTTYNFNGSTWSTAASTLASTYSHSANGNIHNCILIGGTNHNYVERYNGTVWMNGFILPYDGFSMGSSVGSQSLGMLTNGRITVNKNNHYSMTYPLIIMNDCFKINNSALPVSVSRSPSVGNIGNVLTVSNSNRDTYEWKANKKYYRQGPGMLSVGNLQYYNPSIEDHDIFYDINPHRNASVYANAVSQTSLTMNMKWYNNSVFTNTTNQNPSSIKKTVGSNDTIKASVFAHTTGFRQSIPIYSDLIISDNIIDLKQF